MTVRTEFQIPDDVLKAYVDAPRNAEKLLNTALKRTVRARKRLILRRLREEPGRPRSPLRWRSERQRRAFFATNGFGSGIPYRRTGQLARGWFYDIDTKNGEVSIGNTVPYARYVQGDDQQPFHIDTGWEFAAPIISAEIDALEDALIETWYTVVDPFAGVQG